jgi:hypothetical protein
MMAKTLTVHRTLHIRNLHMLIVLLSFGGRGGCCQLLKNTQGLDQLLPNQLFRFTSKHHWRMDFFS